MGQRNVFLGHLIWNYLDASKIMLHICSTGNFLLRYLLCTNGHEKKTEIVFFGVKIDFLRVPRGKYIAKIVNIFFLWSSYDCWSCRKHNRKDLFWKKNPHFYVRFVCVKKTKKWKKNWKKPTAMCLELI